MESRPDLSIVIVSFQVAELLRNCLVSLEKLQTTFPLEVFVVDNASTDGTVKLVREQFPWVRVIANDRNRGFAAANNQGLIQASGKFLMLLNPDTFVPDLKPNALDILLRFMQSHPQAGACGPALRYAGGARQHSAFRFPSLLQIYWDLFPPNWRVLNSQLNGRYRRSLYEARTPFQVDHPLGAALMVRREAAEQVGWLDEAYFIYVEEVDWCLRLHRAGWQIWCVPEAEIIHYEAQSTRQFRQEMFIELWRARLHFFRKHYSPMFNRAAAILIRAGMYRAQRAARRAFSHGEISAEQLARRQEAFDRVVHLTKAETGDEALR